MLNETLKVIRNSNPQLSSVMPQVTISSSTPLQNQIPSIQQPQMQQQQQQQQQQQFNPTPQNQVQQPIPQTVSQQNQVQQQPQMQQFTFPPLTQNGIYSSQNGSSTENDFNPSSLSTTNIVEDKNKDEDDDVVVEAALKAMKQRKLALII